MVSLWLVFVSVFTSCLSRRLEPRIIGSTDANIADFPYMCSLRYSGTHSCGCAIVSANKILTTAQCVDGRSISLLSVTVGETDRTSGVSMALQDVHVHEDFMMGSQTSRNDIAIGTLDTPLDLSNPLISAVTLATGPEDFADKSCTFTGWGSTNSTMTYPTALRQAGLTVLSNDVCGTNYTSLEIQDGHLCTQDVDKTICFGDLGGPIVCEGVLAGLASFGILFDNKCSSSYPSVFTRISFYQDWVTN